MNGAKWNDPRSYGGYFRNAQQFVEREPLLQASLQVVLSVFAVAFFVFFAIRPTLSTITTLIRKIEDQKVVNQKLDTKIRQLAEAQENLAQYGEQVEGQLNEAVPGRPEVEKLSRQIEAISVESGAYISSLSVQESALVGERSSLEEEEERRREGEVFVTFGLAIGGTQEQVKNFLTLLEGMERAVQLTQVAITPPGSSQEAFALVADIKATVYYLPTQGQQQ